jgi:hypothetical protein
MGKKEKGVIASPGWGFKTGGGISHKRFKTGGGISHKRFKTGGGISHKMNWPLF